jgi:hypothetical protein
MSDLLTHVSALPEARRRTARRRYASLRPAIEVMHTKGYNAKDITAEIQKFGPWSDLPSRRVYEAVAYHIRNHLKPDNSTL